MSHSKMPRNMSLLRKEGTRCDVEFLLGPEKESVKAHQLVLLSMSPDICSNMFTQRWNTKDQGDGDCLKIELASNNPESFKLLIEYMYADGDSDWDKIVEEKMKMMTKDAKEELVIDMIHMANMYELGDMVKTSAKHLQKFVGVDSSNCVMIYLATRTLPECKETCQLSFQILKKFLEKVLNDPTQEEMLDTNAWVEILDQDDIFVDELMLFHSVIEKAGLKDILHMIRFPLMPLSALKYVKESEILPEEDIVELQTYFDSGSFTMHPTKFNSCPRRKRIVSDDEELTAALKAILPGETIHLVAKGSYRGPFALFTNNVKIVGYTEGTQQSEMFVDGKRKNPTCLFLHAYDCTISGIKFTVKTISGRGIHVSGNENVLKDLVFVGPAKSHNRHSSTAKDTSGNHGIVIEGSENSLRDLKLTAFGSNGISILEGKTNTVSNVKFENVYHGLFLKNAASNIAQQLEFELTDHRIMKGDSKPRAVKVVGGKENVVSDIKMKAPSHYHAYTEYHTAIETDATSEKCLISSIKNGNIIIDGKNHLLEDIMNTRFGTITLRGEGHKVRKSRAIKLELHYENDGALLESCELDEFEDVYTTEKEKAEEAAKTAEEAAKVKAEEDIETKTEKGAEVKAEESVEAEVNVEKDAVKPDNIDEEMSSD